MSLRDAGPFAWRFAWRFAWSGAGPIAWPFTAAVLLWAATAGAAMADCVLGLEGGTPLASAGVQLAFKPDAGNIRQGQPFALLVKVCPADSRLLGVDASMPEHRHGMNYRPSIKALGDGLWRADGLLLHMAGRWELRFDLTQGLGQIKLRHSLNLP